MKDKGFLDTNILVYAYDRRDPAKQLKAQALLEQGIHDENVSLSTQILSEFFVVITRRIQTPLSVDEAAEVIESLSIIPVAEVDRAMVKRAIETHQRYGISYWDALIVAAAERSGCAQIYSEDLKHGDSYHRVLVVNPF